MASFRTHISYGVALGVLSSVFMYTTKLTSELSVMVAVPVLVAIGSILPDMDSDSSVPFHIAFASITLIVASFVVYKTGFDDWVILLFAVLGSIVFVWGGVGYVVKKFTKHRGMAHSVPTALLVSLIIFFICARYFFSDMNAFLLGVAIGGGFILHLLIDEVYSIINPEGHLFVPNKAFGSALKFFSHSKFINIAVYGSIVFLVGGSYDRIESLAKTFWQQVMG